jgi:hypothetical protein
MWRGHRAPYLFRRRKCDLDFVARELTDVQNAQDKMLG